MEPLSHLIKLILIIYNLLKSESLDTKYESSLKNNDYKFLIIDSFGKMSEFYSKSDIVFLGGSFTKNGGHNPIEAAVEKCAILTGPNVFNWQNLFEDMSDKNSCIIVGTPKELKMKILQLMDNRNLIKNLKNNAFNFADKVFFEEEKLLNLLKRKLSPNA